jgi:hypothetical protein
LLALVSPDLGTVVVFFGIEWGLAMESVEEMMKWMNLTAAEARSIKVAAGGTSGDARGDGSSGREGRGEETAMVSCGLRVPAGFLLYLWANWAYR